MNIKDEQLSSRQMLLDIGALGIHARKLLSLERGYNALLERLIDTITRDKFHYLEEEKLP